MHIKLFFFLIASYKCVIFWRSMDLIYLSLAIWGFVQNKPLAESNTIVWAGSIVFSRIVPDEVVNRVLYLAHSSCSELISLRYSRQNSAILQLAYMSFAHLSCDAIYIYGPLFSISMRVIFVPSLSFSRNLNIIRKFFL